MTTCPRPDKMAFRSKAAAHRYNVKFQSQWKARLWPYLCEPGCGQWHLTTQNYEEQKRIRARIEKRRQQ